MQGSIHRLRVEYLETSEELWLCFSPPKFSLCKTVRVTVNAIKFEQVTHLSDFFILIDSLKCLVCISMTEEA